MNELKTLRKSIKNYRFLRKRTRTLILHNLDVLYRLGANILLRCPIVPEGNLDDDFIKKIITLKEKYPNIRVELMPYHRAGIAKAERLGMAVQKEYPIPNRELLEQLRDKIGNAVIAN